MSWKASSGRRARDENRPSSHAIQQSHLTSSKVVCIYTVMKELDMSSVENCACFNVRRVSRVITQFFDAEVGRSGLRPTQTPILRALQNKEGCPMAELSDYLGME